ncbi:prepilin-type N-terminal cleavage/methylation domain-containing protein [Frigoribacterium sp. ACAM 257]|uniref:type IV pilus modification PilV family protein n=1 Tax=Frigoribacterium sp. ACAM 257 TaxID=2508998 RepID=UPI0011B9F367|nr:prepilin-type N-terminal cleavage/methylation domain-containing protein [Frigoribacterium sp. ACAM 257]TWX38610.1 prepilin-type N-terminal cleavage/methylation domain-containing protein [Frigoribacterium sp. ACAM 257]
MFRRLNDVLRPASPAERDSGFSLVEVIVAMMVFAVISVGVAYSITNSLVLTRESRAREVALNLAEQDLDLMRSQSDWAKVVSADKTTVVVAGARYSVTRKVTPVTRTDGTETDACGAPVGALGAGSTGVVQNKSVTTTVEPEVRRSFVGAVRADTVIAPPSRLNDPEKGTIIVSVTGASGTGTRGVVPVVSVAAAGNGAAALSAPLAATDGQGCTYAYMVKPGNYVVTLSTPGYVSNAQVATPSVPLTVAAAKSSTAKFAYDTASVYSLSYASNRPLDQAVPTLPSGLVTTFAGSGVETLTTSVATTGLVGQQRLYPIGGYNIVAGPASPLCKSPDPGNWSTPVVGTTPGAPPAGAVGQAVAPAVPGTAPVEMGIVQIKNALLRGTVTATLQTTGAAGDPGCALSTTAAPISYTFPPGANGAATVALPFGTYKFSTKVAGLLAVGISSNDVALLTPGSKPGGDVVVLDPRKAQP